MTAKQIGALVLLLAAAGGIAHWRYAAYQGEKADHPLNSRVTFDYDGTVGGLFAQLAAQTGAAYAVEPGVALRLFKGSFKNKSVVEVQAEVAKAAGVAFSPPPSGSKAIQVKSRK